MSVVGDNKVAAAYGIAFTINDVGAFTTSDNTLVPPSQITAGLAPTVTVGVASTARFTDDEVAQPPTVAVKLYVPDALVPTLEIVGFCNADVKLLGPVHE